MSEVVDLAVAQREAARIAAMADIADVRLFDATLHFDRFPDESNAMTWQLEMEPSVSYHDGADFFILEIKYEVVIQEIIDGSTAKEDDTADLAKISFKLGSLYTLESANRARPEPPELDSFAKTMGTMALYPYAREFVQNMTSRMGLPPLTLATFRLPFPDLTVAPKEPDDAKRRSAAPRKRTTKKASASK
ncbi:protein-export chaperone SecB [Micromonospora sp. WMMD987]|uniref:protein-export chaperone SecB n=1 Tax=Micromonospora sp. WMMD987 TaxID=3016089 RepID=UPI00249A5866|nr:protein-export chaperone SecB [Micromonospora sp. WMMD987]WFE95641.1 protein-export chaperone SecB [Micromonospora sp. WMMD987]